MHVMPSRRPTSLPAVLLLAALAAALLAPAAASAAETTGRLLVTLDRQGSRGEMRAAAAALLSSGGMVRDGAQVPQIGLVSVRPRAGVALAALARQLRRRDGVLSVRPERRYRLRVVPNDPALVTPELSPGAPPGTILQWWIPRLGLPAAWDAVRGAGATVAVIDTGADGAHPDLAHLLRRPRRLEDHRALDGLHALQRQDELLDLLADLRADRARGRGQRERDVDVAAVLLDAVDEPELDEVQPELWVDHVGERLFDLLARCHEASLACVPGRPCAAPGERRPALTTLP